VFRRPDTKMGADKEWRKRLMGTHYTYRTIAARDRGTWPAEAWLRSLSRR
jgi:hypothetical protein